MNFPYVCSNKHKTPIACKPYVFFFQCIWFIVICMHTYQKFEFTFFFEFQIVQNLVSQWPQNVVQPYLVKKKRKRVVPQFPRGPTPTPNPWSPRGRPRKPLPPPPTAPSATTTSTVTPGTRQPIKARLSKTSANQVSTPQLPWRPLSQKRCPRKEMAADWLIYLIRWKSLNSNWKIVLANQRASLVASKIPRRNDLHSLSRGRELLADQTPTCQVMRARARLLSETQK